MSLVSVIMPTYNCAKYIGESVESVIGQTITDWELEIVDDCSTDNTLEVLQPYLDKYPNIHYYRLEKNGGPAVARTEALSRASGKYIAFFDSDDLWHADELAMVFDRMGIDTNEVVDGMNTKWNALGFRPGLVGGHCIGVDPYYFIYQAEKLGYHSQIILNGRIVNDGMGKFVADAAVKQMIAAGLAPKKAKVVIFGLTFKENCPDIRNSKVDDVIKALNGYGIETLVVDPWADKNEAMSEYGVTLTDISVIKDANCIIVAVAHNAFKELTLEQFKAMYVKAPDDEKVFLDIKGLYSIKQLEESGMRYWRL